MISHKLKEFDNKDMRDFIDVKGKNLLTVYKKILQKDKGGFHNIYFKKPTDIIKEHKKIVYVSKFEPYNWLIGTGKYLDDVRKETKEFVINKIAMIETKSDNDLFINEVYNLNGGEKFAKSLYSKYDPKRIGKLLSTKEEENPHRQRVIDNLREKGEYYDTYYYCSFGSDIKQHKYTYFYYYKPWSIVIGSGFSMDQLNQEIDIIKEQGRKRVKNEVISTVITNTVILILFIVISFIISRKINSILKSNQQEIEELNEKLNSKVDKQLDEIRQKDMLLAQKYKAQSLGDMLSMITHQWRQPLNSINSITAKLYMHSKSGKLSNDNIIEDTKEIESLINYMSQTITDFKLFYKPSSTKEIFDINDVVKSALNIIFPKYYKGIKPEVVFNGTKNALIYGFKSQVQQILLSIINNSIENFKIKGIKKPQIIIDIKKKIIIFLSILKIMEGG